MYIKKSYLLYITLHAIYNNRNEWIWKPWNITLPIDTEMTTRRRSAHSLTRVGYRSWQVYWHVELNESQGKETSDIAFLWKYNKIKSFCNKVICRLELMSLNKNEKVIQINQLDGVCGYKLWKHKIVNSITAPTYIQILWVKIW